MIRVLFDLETEEDKTIFRMLKRLALLRIKVSTLWQKYNPENKRPNFAPEVEAEFNNYYAKIKLLESKGVDQSWARWKSTYTYKGRTLIVYSNPKTGRQCKRPTLKYLLYEIDNWDKVMGSRLTIHSKRAWESTRELSRKWTIESYDSF
jgi:hypothetical protein